MNEETAVFPYGGFWMLLCSHFYAHVYMTWRVVLPVVLGCTSLLLMFNYEFFYFAETLTISLRVMHRPFNLTFFSRDETSPANCLRNAAASS